jgi:hypothetical protein
MTSEDRFPDMAQIDAELERLLGGGSPSAQAPAWFGDVAVLVRTARAPARPDELAGEADIVARMVELRLAVLADAAIEDQTEAPAVGQDDPDEADAPATPRVNGHVNGVNGRVNGVNGHVNGTAPSAARTAAMDDRTGGSATGDTATGGTATGGTTTGAGASGAKDSRKETTGRDTGGEERVAATAAREPGGPTAREPMESRLRERMSLAELDDYRAKHGGERYYVAKHSAPAAEEPPHAVARTVGRVIAMKAVAITTAAALGVAAAAAATTGIVANVVVPAFNDHFQHMVPTSESPDDEQKDDDGETGSGRSSRSASDIVTCQTQLAPCVPPDLNSVATDPVTGGPLVTPPTTAPDSTSTTVPDTTTTTSSTTTSTTEPAPTTTTPTTVAPDPQALSSSP